MVSRVYLVEKTVLLLRIGFLFILFDFIGNECRGLSLIESVSFCVWNIVTGIVIVLFQTIIASEMISPILDFYRASVIFGHIASILYSVAFYYFFGRHSLNLCDPWIGHDPRNFFLFFFLFGTIFSVIESILFFSLPIDY